MICDFCLVFDSIYIRVVFLGCVVVFHMLIFDLNLNSWFFVWVVELLSIWFEFILQFIDFYLDGNEG